MRKEARTAKQNCYQEWKETSD